MSNLVDQVYEELRSAWRFRWVAFGVAAAIAVAGWVIVFSLPDRYEASARLFVDTRTALKPLIQEVSIGQDVNAQLNYVRQSLFAGQQLRQIAEETGVLSPTITDPAKQARILDDLSEKVVVTVSSASDRDKDIETAGSIYGIAYQDVNRERSLRVVQKLLDTLMEKTLSGKRANSEGAQKFLEEQIKQYEVRLQEAEDRLAEFKKRHVGLMPNDSGTPGGYFAQLQAEIDAERKAQGDLNIAISKRSELARQLRGEAVVSAGGSTPVIGGAGITAGTDTVSRIKETQAHLDDLLLRFTDKHPDVVATRETLEELKRRRAAEIEGLRRGDPNAVAASGAGSNPVFQSIQLALNQADVEIASLRGSLEQHRAKAAELRQRLDTAPQVEAEFARLNRDYDVNKAQHTALLENYEKARLGEQADSAGSVRFEIVQPATANFTPVFPRRSVMLAAAFIAALVLGGALAYVLHLMKPVVGTAQNLIKLTGLPVLGVVSGAFPGRSREDMRRDLMRYAACIGGLFVAFVVMVVLSRAGVRLAFGTAGVG